MLLLIDLTIIFILVICLAVGFFRNPVMSGINVVLYVLFAYIFMLIINACLPSILSLFNTSISDLASYVSNALSSANDELQNIGSQLGIDLSFITGDYLENSYYNNLFTNVGYNISFLAGSILALPFSYGISWLIYGLGIKKLLHKKEVYCNKIYHRFISLGVNFVYAFFLVCFILSPYQSVAKTYNQAYIVVDDTSNKLTTFVNTNGNTLNELDDISHDADEFLKENETYLVKLDEYYGVFNSYEGEIDSLVNEAEVLVDELNAKMSSLSSSEQIAAREVISRINEGLDQVDDFKVQINDVIGEYQTYFDDYEEYRGLIDDYENSLKPMLQEMKDSFTIATDISNYANQVKSYFDSYVGEEVPYSSWFSFLLDNVNFTGSTINGENFDEEFIIFSGDLSQIFSDDINKIQSFIDTTIEDKIGDVSSLREKFDSLVEQFNSYKGDLDEAFIQIDDALEKYDELKLKIESLLNEGQEIVDSL